MHLGIVAQRGNPRAVELAERIRGAVPEASVALDESTAIAVDEPDFGVSVDRMAACDLVVSIGGDGTFLFAARGAGTTPMMGINIGEVGFLNAVPPEEAVDAVRGVVSEIRGRGEPSVYELPRVVAENDEWSLSPALNEITVMGPQRGRASGVGLEIRVDGALYAGSRADGALVATPAGSTAYNLSEQGPLVHPGTDALVLTEMCARSPMPSLVLDSDSEVSVRVEEAERAVVVADGRRSEEVTPPTQVEIRRAAEPLRIAGPPLDFFAALGKLD
ncbi:NAD(+) kinase [Halobacteriales archaeon QS_4_70_19]|nr:MAG: NAD(+) kinase [Halobacteriales archaeon QS_4_70_19]